MHLPANLNKNSSPTDRNITDTQTIAQKFYKNPAVTNNMTNTNLDTYDNLKRELDLFFGDHNIEEEEDFENDDVEPDDTRTEEEIVKARMNGMSVRTETVKTAIQNFFNYSEKPFEEDDISNFDGIGINEPEDDHKERKCYACSRRFMLNDSFDDHMKECILAKLLNFITDCYQLSIIKKHKAISAQEFIRRMIFAVKNIVKSLAMSYRVLSRPTNRSIPQTINEQTIVKNESKQLFNTNQHVFHAPELPKTPILFTTSRKILSKETAVVQSHKSSDIFPKHFNFVAKCQICQQVFNSIQALETHNQQRHNNRSVATASTGTASSVSSLDSFSLLSAKRNGGTSSGHTLMDLLKADDYSHEGIVDVVKLRQKSPKILNINLKDYQS